MTELKDTFLTAPETVYRPCKRCGSTRWSIDFTAQVAGRVELEYLPADSVLALPKRSELQLVLDDAVAVSDIERTAVSALVASLPQCTNCFNAIDDDSVDDFVKEEVIAEFS